MYLQQCREISATRFSSRTKRNSQLVNPSILCRHLPRDFALYLSWYSKKLEINSMDSDSTLFPPHFSSARFNVFFRKEQPNPKQRVGCKVGEQSLNGEINKGCSEIRSFQHFMSCTLCRY